MKFGLFGINMNTCSNPDVAARVAQAAEAASREALATSAEESRMDDTGRG